MYGKLLIAFTLITLSIPSIAAAETSSPSAMREAAREARKENMCARVTAHVVSLTNRLSNDENMRENRHQKAIDRVQSLISRLSAAGVNTDKLRSDVTMLEEKKQTWSTAYTTLQNELNNTKSYACGSSQGAYADAVKQAKAQRLVMHNANKDFWTFMTQTVIPDIQSARAQIKNTTLSPSPKNTL